MAKAKPAFSFTNDPDTGIFRMTDGQKLREEYPDLMEAWEQWSKADDVYLSILSETKRPITKRLEKAKDIMFKKLEEYEFLLKLIQDYE